MSVIIPSTPLSRDFYARDTVTVAQDLLGKVLVREVDGVLLAGIIVETEAYRSDDAACHAYKGQTPRTAPLFGPVGYTYVYFIYGTHFCVNFVSRDASVAAGGVLIRALEPIAGIAYMQQRRGVSGHTHLTNGPGKLTKALAITRDQIGIDATQLGSLYVGEGRSYSASDIVATPRIGISQAQDLLWRFLVKGNGVSPAKPNDASTLFSK
ncbi:MAG: DNA-3-methyladenine glycosylase [Candidatus Babeliales bacterium]